MSKYKFNRLFSKSIHKNQKLSVAEMTFFKDFVDNENGDLYPVIYKSEDCEELVSDNKYLLKNGRSERFFCRFFPYATYEISASVSGGSVGFGFNFPADVLSLTFTEDKLCFSDGEINCDYELPKTEGSVTTMLVTCRPGEMDVYFKNDGKISFFVTIASKKLWHTNKQSVFENTSVCLAAQGKCEVFAVSSYIDNGIAIADIRAVRYENGSTMYENGKIYFTASVRMEKESFQGVFSWTPATSEFTLTGCIFFDCGDGVLCGDVASSLLYNRKTDKWMLWMCAFSHGHILGHSEFLGDVRFGINYVDAELMEKAAEDSDFTSFLGFEGDEDPDFYFDEDSGLWRMAICRLDTEKRQYKYVFFQSERPFDGYSYVCCGVEGCETGGSFVNIEGERCFICGNSFTEKSNYRIYCPDGLEIAEFDYPDGGFRGWGTVVPVQMGSRTRYFHITFDRHNAGDYNWSYGNLYCYELKVTD